MIPTGDGLEAELTARIARQRARIAELVELHRVAERKAEYTARSSRRAYELLKQAELELEGLLAAAGALGVPID